MAALPPLGGPPPSLSSLKGRSKTEHASARDADPGTVAMQAQRDASKQIEAASASVDEARHDADTRIDQIHDYYDGRSEEEYAREEGAYEKQRLQGYERLKELKRTQEAEISRARRDGERDLDKTTNYYRDTQYATERAGDEKLKELQVEQGRSYEYAVKTKNQDQEMEQGQFHREFEDQRASHEAKLGELTESNHKEYERIRGNSTEANEKAEQSFEQKYQSRVKDTDDVIIDLEARASEGIRQIRQDTTQKLAAYSSRQRDPFYRMLDMDASVKDDGDSYVLTATIPVHEQKHVSVSVKGNQLVLTGARRSEEKLDLEPGHMQGTNAYQSFLETFPISWPVNANKMTREFDGDQLIVRVPKKMEYGYHSQAEAKVPVQRARLERPKFPENLPHVSGDPYVDSDALDSAARPSRKGKGSGTLG